MLQCRYLPLKILDAIKEDALILATCLHVVPDLEGRSTTS
jgi:hypothetical protein